ncbi:MAG: hypothetical protein KME54_17705 [Tolypothrix brevis GSE-NOS-MK-07-07A]|jgi:hypothetical protein|nr:hypothetical protein [Tolypothrix brevis GSE-NOS-MK-07-07A]
MATPKHIKTRINTNTKAGSAAARVTGFSPQELEQILKGDRVAIKKLRDCYYESRMAELTLPMMEETIPKSIEVNKRWNQLLGKYVAQGSAADLAIESSATQASFANMKYVHGTKELKEGFQAQVEIERERHSNQIDYQRAKFYVDMVFQNVDADTRQFEQGKRVAVAQLVADEAYEMESTVAVWEHGTLDHIKRKNYESHLTKPGNIWRRMKNALGI